MILQSLLFEAVSGRSVPYRFSSRRVGDVATCYANLNLTEKFLESKATKTLTDMCRDNWSWQSKAQN